MSTEGIGASTQRAVATDSLTAARYKMAQSSAALTDAIERGVGQRPADIRLTGRDTIDVRFRNPSFW